MMFSAWNSAKSSLKNGVIYSGYDPSTVKPKNKGRHLQSMISSGTLGDIKSILFVDDSLRNLKEVESEIPSNISFLGIHFTKIHTKIRCDFEEKELDSLDQYAYSTLKKETKATSLTDLNPAFCPMIP